jgi:hypothetical protein
MRKKEGGTVWENVKGKKKSLRSKHIYTHIILTANAISEAILQAK